MTRLSALVDNERIVFTSGKLRWQAAMAAQHDALVTQAVSPGLANVYPIAYYTPESPSPGSPVGAVELVNANFAEALRNAIEAAQDANGGTILIPAGLWEPGDEEFEIVCTTDRDKAIVIRGAGQDVTSIAFPDAYTGTSFKFTPESTGLCFNNGIQDLSIGCLTANVANTGVGLHLEAQVAFQARNITIRNFLGGTGLKTRQVGVDQTNQYCQLHSFTVAGCDVNYDLKAFINGQGYGVYSNTAATRDYLFDDVKLSIYGGNTQTNAPVAVELAGNGGCRVAIYDYYWEGLNAATIMFKLPSPAGGFNQLDVQGFHLGGSPGTFLDVDLFNNVTLRNIYTISNAATILKARNGAIVCMENCGDPVSNPSQFDLDAASRAALVCIGFGGTQFAGGRITGDRGFALPAYATGSEPSSPAAGDLHRDSTYDRPTVRAASSWKRVALRTDDDDLSSLLAPHALEIWDPAVLRLRSVIASELDTLTGLINGLVMAAPAAGQRPQWNTFDEYFGQRPSFTCALTGNHYLQVATLGTTIAAGARPAMFAVYRVEGANDPSNRRAAIVAEHGADHTSGIAIGASDLIQSNRAWGLITGSGGTQYGLGATGTDAYGHVSYLQSSAAAGVELDYDLNATVTGSDPNVTTSIIDRCTLGGAFDGGAYAGANITIAYAALLSEALDADARAKIIKAAMTRYRLR